MSDFSLRLIPDLSQQSGSPDSSKKPKSRPPTVELKLYPEDDPLIRFQRETPEQTYVCSEMNYVVTLCGAQAHGVEAIEFYCNDFKLGGKIKPPENKESHEQPEFPIKLPRDGKIFHGLIGNARITLVLQMKNGGEQQTLYTPWVPIYVNENDLEALQACTYIAQMADYIFDNCGTFWPETQAPDPRLDVRRSMVLGGLKPNGQQDLETQIPLLEDLIRVYERSLPFFRTASKSRVRPEKQWVDFERATYLSADTIRGLSQPSRLMPCSRNGIQIPGREGRYIPAKVVAPAGKVDYDIYENRYVVGFLRHLMDWLAVMSAEIDMRLQNGRKPPRGKLNSADYLKGSKSRRLQEDRRRLKDIQGRIFGLYTTYHRLMPTVAVDKVSGPPRPTAIFRSVHHYRGIYELACQWFQFGVYDFKREDFLAPFMEGHKLYEFYVLIRLLNYLTQEAGMELTERRTVRWSGKGEPKDPIDGRQNVFSLRKGDRKATFFYEPWIYGYGSQDNLPELGLFCISSFGFDGKQKRRHYYKPDYVVKLQDGDAPAGYIILDAKFSDLYVTQRFHMPELVFKYRCGLAPAEPERDKLLGLALLYGKPGGEVKKTVCEICDQAGPDPSRWPFVRLIALGPDNEPDHETALAAAVPL